MKKIKILNIFFLVFITANAFAGEEVFVDQSFQKKRREEYHIDARYIAGSNLIYDCRFDYFACVNDDSFKECDAKRTRDFLNNEEKSYSCTPLKKFATKEECVFKNYELQNRNFLKKFCHKQD